ncbi:MAG: EamA family transporter [Candidatus Xenobia bacterium]
MPAFAVLLVLASALLHAGWNALLKRHAEPEQAALGVSLSCAITVFVMAFAIHGTHHWIGPGTRWALTAGCFETAYFWALGRAMAGSPMSLVYTCARGGAVLLIWPLSIAVTGESVTLLMAGGAGLVCLGIALTQRLPAGQSQAGLPAALLAAALIAANHVCYKQAEAAGLPPSNAFAISMAVMLLLSLTRYRMRMMADRTMVVAGIGAALSFMLALWAMSSSGPGAVLSLRNLSIPFGMVLSTVIGERPGPRQWVGAGIIAAGALLIAL